MIPSDRIVPEEYRVNSQMINKLIKQNKELTLQLDRKQDEIDRLNVLVGSLRGKLIKYTELNKKLGQTSTHPPRFSPDEDVLQVNKNRQPRESREPDTRDSQLENRIGDIYSKLEALTNLMAGTTLQSPPAVSQDQRDHVLRVPTSASVSHRPLHGGASEDDILTQESAELKSLEDQIDLLKRKLLIKRENELRKLSLNKELLDLMDKLDVSKPSPEPASTSPPAPVSANTTPHCDHCHKSASQSALNGHHNTGAPGAPNSTRNPPYMSMAQALETPTPAQRSAPKPNDTLW